MVYLPVEQKFDSNCVLSGEIYHPQDNLTFYFLGWSLFFFLVRCLDKKSGLF